MNKSKYIKRFVDGRSPQSEHDFLRDLDLHDEYAESAIAVRQAVAEHSELPESFVYANDRFGVELLPFGSWGSLDRFELIFVLEKWLGIELPPLVTEKLPDPDRDSSLTVGEFARRIAMLVSDGEGSE